MTRDEQNNCLPRITDHKPLFLSVLSRFYGQATKGVRWMPWRQTATKDVATCDKPRGEGSTL